jgi:hypothetical protein
MHEVCAYDSDFVQKCSVGLSNIQKCTTALHMLAYGVFGNVVDEYCRLNETTTIEVMKRFVLIIRACFEGTYLRQPTCEDIVHQMLINKERGFLGMFGSID